MPPSRLRPTRSAVAPTAAGTARGRALDEPPAEWSDAADDAASPLAALVEAAAEAGVVDPRALAERLGLEPGELRSALADPAILSRERREELARALGVDRAVVRAACDAVRGGRVPDESPDDALRSPGTAAATDVDSGGPDEPAPEPLPAASADAPSAGAPDTYAPSADADLPGARPASVVELLEHTIAAVEDDALGRRVRLSLLATAQTAAAEAGRLAPPELYELRRRVLRGAVPWMGDGGVFVEAPNAGDDHALLEAVAGAVRAAQAQGSGYDDLFAPVHDDALDALLRRVTASVRPAALGATSACAVTPPLYGRHLVVCSADAGADQRRVALRRALAHVLLGHVGEFTPLPFPAPAPVARAADVFALADLVPFWQVHDWRRKGRLGWAAVMAETARIATALAGDWDAARAGEAGRLRVLLYREWKI